MIVISYRHSPLSRTWTHVKLTQSNTIFVPHHELTDLPQADPGHSDVGSQIIVAWLLRTGMHALDFCRTFIGKQTKYTIIMPDENGHKPVTVSLSRVFLTNAWRNCLGTCTYKTVAHNKVFSLMPSIFKIDRPLISVIAALVQLSGFSSISFLRRNEKSYIKNMMMI